MTDRARELVELKPCPFCGGEAQRMTIGDDEPNNAGGDVICCTKCQASSHVEFGYKENLVSIWNSRTDALTPPEGDTVSEGVVERVGHYIHDESATGRRKITLTEDMLRAGGRALIVDDVSSDAEIALRVVIAVLEAGGYEIENAT